MTKPLVNAWAFALPHRRHFLLAGLWICFLIALTPGGSGQDAPVTALHTGTKDLGVAYKQLSKDMETVKSAEEFAVAINKLSDAFDKLNAGIAGVLKLPAPEMGRAIEAMKKIPLDMGPQEDHNAGMTAAENLAQKFNTSPQAVKAWNRFSAGVVTTGKLTMQLAAAEKKLNKERHP